MGETKNAQGQLQSVSIPISEIAIITYEDDSNAIGMRMLGVVGACLGAFLVGYFSTSTF